MSCTITSTSYNKIILHSIKYQYKSIIGCVLGNITKNKNKNNNNIKENNLKDKENNEKDTEKTEKDTDINYNIIDIIPLYHNIPSIIVMELSIKQVYIKY